MREKKVEIFYGDIGTVRNELSAFMRQVQEIISITQSVTASYSHTNAMLTILLVYYEYVETPAEYRYEPIEKKTKEQYL